MSAPSQDIPDKNTSYNTVRALVGAMITANELIDHNAPRRDVQRVLTTAILKVAFDLDIDISQQSQRDRLMDEFSAYLDTFGQ